MGQYGVNLTVEVRAGTPNYQVLTTFEHLATPDRAHRPSMTQITIEPTLWDSLEYYQPIYGQFQGDIWVKMGVKTPKLQVIATFGHLATPKRTQ